MKVSSVTANTEPHHNFLSVFKGFRLLTILLPLVLSACFSSNAINGSTVNTMYSKGPVTGATATLLDANGNVIAGPVMTVDGSASFANVTYTGSVFASFSGGTYTDEATGMTVTLDSDFVIRSGVIDNMASGSTLDIVATPLTEIAFQRAEAAAVVNLDLSTVNFFMEMIADEYGLDGINLTEVMPTPLEDISGTTDSDLYGTVLAAITQQQMDEGDTPSSSALESYIADNVIATDETAFNTALGGLSSNTNTSPYIDDSIVTAINDDSGADNVDTVDPVITLIGANPQIIQINTTYNQSTVLLATASDDVNGDITNRLLIDFSDVDSSIAGDYNVVYRVSDLSGNETTLIRIVSVLESTVVDTTKPVITLSGNNPQTVEVGNSYIEAGATASDNVDGNISGNIVINSSAINTNTTGSYNVTYDVSDAAGNAAITKTRTVLVIDTTSGDTTKPVITLTGANPQSIIVNSSYTELGATASDNIDGNITANIVVDASAVNTSSLGSYTVNYDVVDAAGNDANTVTRVVNVITQGSDITPPTAVITFPTPVSATEGDTVTVRGTAADENEITMVRVNGVDVSSTDNFRTWNIAVNLNPGVNTLTVETIDADGNTDSNATSVQITSRPFYLAVSGIAIDGDNDRAFVVDSSDVLMIVNLNTGLQTILAEDLAGGPSESPVDVAVDIAGIHNRALVAMIDHNNDDSILAVDINTGVVSVLSDSITPNTTNALGTLKGITIDRTNNRALVADSSLQAVVAINLDTGARTLLAIGLDRLQDIVLDSNRNRALVVQGNPLNDVVAINLDSGQANLIYNGPPSNEGAGFFSDLQGITLDIDNTRALLVDRNQDEVLAIDLFSNTVTVAYDNTAPDTDNPFDDVDSIELDGANGRALIVQDTGDYILAVDLDTGARTSFSDNSVGPNSLTAFSQTSALDTANNRLLVADQDNDVRAIIGIDLTTGEHTILSDNNTADTSIFFNPRIIEMDSNNNQAIVLSSSGSTLQTVNLTTGVRAVLSDSTTPNTANLFGVVQDVVVDNDTSKNRAFVTSRVTGVSASLTSVDLTTGARTIISNNFSQPFGIALDRNNDRAFVSDVSSGSPVIKSINLTTSAVGTFSIETGGYYPDIELDSANNRVLAVAYDATFTIKSIMAFNLADGTASVLSDDSTPNAFNDFTISNLSDITIDHANNRAFVSDYERNAVFVIDLVDGQRVYFSH